MGDKLFKTHAEVVNSVIPSTGDAQTLIGYNTTNRSTSIAYETVVNAVISSTGSIKTVLGYDGAGLRTALTFAQVVGGSTGTPSTLFGYDTSGNGLSMAYSDVTNIVIPDVSSANLLIGYGSDNNRSFSIPFQDVVNSVFPATDGT